MLENNYVTFGVKVINGKWPQGYTDSYSPVYIEYLNAILNGKDNKLWQQYAKTQKTLIWSCGHKSRSYVSHDGFMTMYPITKYHIKVTKILHRQVFCRQFCELKSSKKIAHHDWILKRNCFNGLKDIHVSPSSIEVLW